MRHFLARLARTTVPLLIASYYSVAHSWGFTLPDFSYLEHRDFEFIVSFIFAEDGRPPVRVYERVRCTYEGMNSETGVHTWRGDKQQDFVQALKSGVTVSYDFINFCSAVETNYAGQFAVQRGGERWYSYPEDLDSIGVTVKLFALDSVGDAL